MAVDAALSKRLRPLYKQSVRQLLAVRRHHVPAKWLALLHGQIEKPSINKNPGEIFTNAGATPCRSIMCCACKPDDAIGADNALELRAPCCSVTAALCDDVDSERLRLNATGPARDMKTLAKSKTQKALWQINDPDAPLHLPLRAPHHKNAFVAAAEAMAAAAPAPSPRPTTTTRTKGMTYFQRLAADAEAARQKRRSSLKAEARRRGARPKSEAD